MGSPASQQEPLELRVLTGLQSGAALPLEDSLAVGPEEESDLLLLDDGHAPQRLRVRLLPDGGLLLEALDDGVLLASGAVLQGGESTPLAPGDAFRAGEVWLAVQGAGEPWGAWTAPDVAATAGAPDAAALAADAPEEAAIEPLPALVADFRPPRPAARARTSVTRPMRTFGSVIVAAGLLSTMLGVAALVRQAAQDEADAPLPETPKADAAPASGGPAASAVQPSVTGAQAPEPAQPPSVTEAEAPAPAHRGDGRGRLQVTIPGEGTVNLPFDIEEVLLGSESHVTLTDGRRLAPGDRVGEWRLTEIRPGALVFDGPRKVQIGW